MRFSFKLNEIQYIQKKFKFSQLLGVELKIFPVFGVEKKLIENGVITRNSHGDLELGNEYRYLFTAWSKMRYTVVRPDENMDKEFYCILASEKDILIFSQKDNDVEVDLIDFNSDVMDVLLGKLAEIDFSQTAETSFNFSIDVDKASKFLAIEANKDYEKLSKEFGISPEMLEFYVSSINKEDGFPMILCEDIVENVGALTKLVVTDRGICALKHVTPENLTKERMVIIFGDAQQVINSLYNF